MPLPIANRVAAAVTRMLARPDVLARMEPLANEIDGKSDPQTFAAMMKEDLATWIEVAKTANIKPE
jgi:tripartite-type tricarboxylate transporter receptor subunit TctC